MERRWGGEAERGVCRAHGGEKSVEPKGEKKNYPNGVGNRGFISSVRAEVSSSPLLLPLPRRRGVRGRKIK